MSCIIAVKLSSMAAAELPEEARRSRPRLAVKAGEKTPDATHDSSGFRVSPILHAKSHILERGSVFRSVFM